jgi:hypothetical protein
VTVVVLMMGKKWKESKYLAAYLLLCATHKTPQIRSQVPEYKGYSEVIYT